MKIELGLISSSQQHYCLASLIAQCMTMQILNNQYLFILLLIKDN